MKLVHTFAAALAAFSISTSAMADVGETPEQIDGATTINSEEALQKFDEGVVFIDVRSTSDFEAGRIPDAVHLDVHEGLTEAALAEDAALDDEIVFYCNGLRCQRSWRATEKALEWGYTDVQYYREGFPAWDAAGYPVE